LEVHKVRRETRPLNWGATHGFFVNAIYGYMGGSVVFEPAKPVEEAPHLWVVPLMEPYDKRAEYLKKLAEALDLSAEIISTPWERPEGTMELSVVRLDDWRLLETAGDAWRRVIHDGVRDFPLAPIAGVILATGGWTTTRMAPPRGRPREVRVLTFFTFSAEGARDYALIMRNFAIERFEIIDTTITTPTDYDESANVLRGEETVNIKLFVVRARHAKRLLKLMNENEERAYMTIQLARGRRPTEEGEEE